MSQGKINFNAGPAAMPPEVLHEMAKAVKEYKKTGMSILELPHRSPEFHAILEESNALVRELCSIGTEYEVLWIHGGGRTQFAMIPLNFLNADSAAGYLDTGHWASEAISYALPFGAVKVLASGREQHYRQLPPWPAGLLPDLNYVHITTNNTIYGTQYKQVPHITAPLIADMSSDIFSTTRNYSQYALFYAAAQKNLGTPGIALAVVHRDFLKQAAYNVPPIWSYKAHVQEKGVLNTANVSGVYTSLLMLRWIKARGIAAIEHENNRKASLLYQTIDNSQLFTNNITEVADRSLMNVCFTAHDTKVADAFLAYCHQNDIVGIEGHRSAGGFRVSLYNAITYSATETLVEVMNEFERGWKG